MKKIKNFGAICFRFLVSVFVIILLVVLSNIGFYKDENFERIYSKFLGKKSNAQSIIEIWNIDSFESGSKSKSEFLNSCAQSFQKKNKGIYFLVRNLTEQECLNLIQAGSFPDLYSCSYGVANKIKDYVCEIKKVDISKLDSGAQSAGKVDESIYAVAWCKGAYFLISTKEKLQKAKVEDIDNFKFADNIMNLGYVISGKKKDKITYSISFSNSKYLMPQIALKTYNEAGVNFISGYSYNKELQNQSQYSAYCDFIAGNSVLLLGSQRDVFRLDNRIKLGKVSDVIVEQITTFSDLMQFMFLSKNIDAEKLDYAKSFIEFMISDECQSLIKEMGMFSVTNVVESDLKFSAMQNITPYNFSDYKTFNVFIEKDEIIKLQDF